MIRVCHYLPALLITILLCAACGQTFSQSQRVTGESSLKSSRASSYSRGLTQGRARSLFGVCLGLISLVIGQRVHRRLPVAQGKIGLRRWAVSALITGFAAVLLCVLQLTTTTGNLGTGGGKLGAFVGLLLGAIGIALSILSLRKT